MRFKYLRKPNRARVLGLGLPLLLLVGVGVLGAMRGGQTGSDITWNADMAQARTIAQSVHRPLLLEFHTPGCEWCAKMEAETFSDSRVLELSRRFVCIRLDSEMEPELARQYDVHEYPTTVFVAADGRELGRRVGYVPPDDFVTLQSRALRLDKEPGRR